MEIINSEAKLEPITSLRPHPRNPRQGDVGAIHESIAANGFYGFVVAQRSTGHILAGNHRFLAAQQAGASELPVVWVDVDDERALRILLADNRANDRADYDRQQLAELLQAVLEDAGSLSGTLFDGDDLEALLAELDGGGSDEGGGEGGGGADPSEARRSLADRFGVPPFTVLDARQGYWQERKRAWLGLGIQSEVGRELAGGTGANTGKNSAMNRLTGRLARELDDNTPVTSIFDPVLCELAYRWFCPPGGVVLDPFAGGSVRGVVASELGRQYVGVELRGEQVAANREQAAEICAEGLQPVWHEGDSRNIGRICEGLQADFVFSCPPYADLEKYSDDERDLSTLDYAEFRAAYRDIIARSVELLRPDRFACFVVGEVRDRRGNYYGFVPDTIRAFEDAGARFYNEAVLVTAIGTLPLRAGGVFQSGRKLGKTHQNVLVFLKGDAKRATAACGPVDVPDLAEQFGEVVE